MLLGALVRAGAFPIENCLPGWFEATIHLARKPFRDEQHIFNRYNQRGVPSGCPRTGMLMTRLGTAPMLCKVAVGIPVTRDPPHRSVRALLAHTAPVSDDGGEAFLRPRVKNAGLG